MQSTKITIKPRAPMKKVVDAAKKEGSAVPITRAPFELSVPVYDVSDIVSLAEKNDQKVLGFIAKLLNSEVSANIRAQLADDEQFPPDSEVDVSNFDLDALTLDKLSEQTSRAGATEMEFTEEQFKEFGADFVKTLLPKYASVPKAEVKLLNTANVLTSGFKDVRNEQEKMDKVKSNLDVFMQTATDEVVDKYSDMYEYFTAMYEKRSKALAKRQERTDVFLD